MNEIEGRSAAKALEIPARGRRRILAEREQPFEAEDRVIQIARAAAILESAVGVQTAAQERGNQVARFTQRFGGLTLGKK